MNSEEQDFFTDMLSPNKKSWFTKERLKQAGVVLLVLLALSAGGGYIVTTDQKKALREQNEQIKSQLEIIDLTLEQARDSIYMYEADSFYYQQQYNNERSRNSRLQRQINSIFNMRFNRAYLDSLADNYEYR